MCSKSKSFSSCVFLSAYIEMASGCPSGWTLNSNTNLCYNYYTNLKSHDEALTYCVSQDSILATPKDAAETNFIANNVISQYSQYAWIGLFKRTSGEPWTYFDGSPLTPTLMSWNLWRSGFPSVSHTCALLKGEDMQYKLETAPCNYRYNFVCKKPLTNIVCPTNWFRSPLGSICYKQFDSSSTFQQSEGTCNGNGSDILMPRHPGEDVFLSWYFHKNHEFYKIWIGYYLQNTVFSWHSGNQTNYTSWEIGEPNSHEDCSVYALSSGNPFHKWYGLDCTLTAITYCQNTNFYTLDTTTAVSTVLPTTQKSTTLIEATTERTSQAAQTSETVAFETTSLTSQLYETTQNNDITSSIISTTETATTTIAAAATTTTIATTSTQDLSSNQSPDTTGVTISPGVQCGCFCLKNQTNITTEELESIITQIKSNLTVDTKTLSSAIRQLTSAYDPRVSSQSIGSVGIAILVSIGIFFLFLDFVPTNGCLWKKKMKLR